MDKKQQYLFALILAIAGSMTLAGCSSSSVSDSTEVSADELPVVDAATDQLPDQMDQPKADGTVAEATAPQEAPTADGLAPEASVDVPTTPAATTADAAPAAMPANSPSFDAPPSMNETAAPSSAPVAQEDHSAPTAPATGGGSELYEVKSGDTLMKVAFMVYGDVYQWRKILEANADRISDPARLVKGTQLKVDNAPNDSYYNGYERYLIKSGDTLGVISGDIYGSKNKWKDLWKMNDGLVKDPNRIYAGFFLRYTAPEGGTPLAKSKGDSDDSANGRDPSSVGDATVAPLPAAAPAQAAQADPATPAPTMKQ
jgi:nucleoid-associated protein YgaU